MEVHRVVFMSEQAQKEKAEMEEMIKNEIPRENLVIFNLETKKMEVAFFQREVRFSLPFVPSRPPILQSITPPHRNQPGSHSGLRTMSTASGW